MDSLTVEILQGKAVMNAALQVTPACYGRRFFMFWALLFLCHQFGLSLYRFISTLARNIVVANAAGMMLLLCVFLMNGFVIQRRYLHPWVLWSVSLLLSLLFTAKLAAAIGFQVHAR